MHLLYLFILGVPAYRIRFYVQINLATIERTFRIFRQAIYDTSLHELKVLKLSGMIEVDEALLVDLEKENVDGDLKVKVLFLGYIREMER